MNGDGVLNQAERRAARQDRMSKMVRRFDRDRSGDVSRAEARVKPESRLFRFFTTIDANRNGRVTKAELMASKDIKFGRNGKGKRRYLRKQL
jgi:Ca2+-binding EF-hand superfamily protein